MCLHTPNLDSFIVYTRTYAGGVFFTHTHTTPQKMVQCRQKIGCENDVISERAALQEPVPSLPTSQFGILDVPKEVLLASFPAGGCCQSEAV